jgi:hypothetical protein
MRHFELERLLEKTVADALGVPLPEGPQRRTKAKLPRHALPRRAKSLAMPGHHHHRAAEHV